MSKCIIILSLILFSLNSICQNLKRSDQPTTDTSTISKVDSLQTIVPPSYIATVHFSNGKISKDTSNIITIPGASLIEIEKKADSLNAGKAAFISFYDIKLIDRAKDTTLKIFDNFSCDLDSLQKQIMFYDDNLEEFEQLTKLNFISGFVYFSGWDFRNVMTVSISTSPALLKTYFSRCGPGSTIVFEYVIYKNEDGSLSRPLSRIIKL